MSGDRESIARRSVSILYLALVLLATGVAMVPAYRFVVFVIADQADEYSKASVAYGPQVPANVEGGSPLFIAVSLIPMIGLFAAGVICAIRLARRTGLNARATAITVALLAGAVAAAYVSVQLVTGPTWPPTDLVTQ